MYEQSLIDAGFSKHQASVYNFLVANGPRQASAIARETHISRTLIYRVLEELEAYGLVEKTDKVGEVSTFAPGHPIKLHDMVEERKKAADLAAASIESVVGNLTSEYNKTIGKPGVRFFEGESGVRYVLEDSLKSKTEILSYVDVETVEKHYVEVNAPYLKARERLGIKKKLLVNDTPAVRAVYGSSKETVSEVRLIPAGTAQFSVSMQIYDNKVTYLTLIPGKEIGVIIEDPNIYAMHKHMFEVLYEKSEPLYTPSK